MRWGVPLIGDRVAPRCTHADGLLLADVRQGRVVAQTQVPTAIRTPVELIEALVEHDVQKLVCGGIGQEVRDILAVQSVAVVENVACTAEQVVTALDAGSLCPGYGFGTPLVVPPGGVGSDQAAAPDAPLKGADCLACEDRLCLLGIGCPMAPAGTPRAAPEERRLLEAAADIAGEEERTLCRVAEVVYFCLEMRYRRIGLAFCQDLLDASRILASVLRRFFEVVPVWCKVGGVASGGAEGAPCNPLGQAHVLNQAGTDINVAVGLCIGADCLFNRNSHAPVTHLFVKDRSLANNPIGALYSDHYLRESANPAPGRRKGALDEARAKLRAAEGGSAHWETRS
jgi:uncharacterized metal-binding protein